MAEQSVTLQPGEAKAVTFEAIPREAKTYQVSVDGLSGSFVATEAPAKVRIQIRAPDKTPIVNARVCHDSICNYTDANGYCWFELSAGYYHITVSAPGYKNISSNATYEAGKSYDRWYYMPERGPASP